MGVATGGLTKGGTGIQFFPSREEGEVDRGADPGRAGGKKVKFKARGWGEGAHGEKGGRGGGAGLPVRMLWARVEFIFGATLSQHWRR